MPELPRSLTRYVGVRAGGRLQTALTVVKVVAILMLVVAGLFAGGTPAPADQETTGTSLTPFVLAMVAGLFTFDGWEMVTYTAGETGVRRIHDPVEPSERSVADGLGDICRDSHVRISRTETQASACPSVL